MSNLIGEKKFCFSCMKEHEVETVELLECTDYRGVEVSFTARYEYCRYSDEHIENESMIRINRAAMKEAYQYTLSANNKN